MNAVMLDRSWVGQRFAAPTPLDVASIETAILERLRSRVGVIEVAHYPDTPETYRLTHRTGSALVRYRGAEYGTLIDTAAIVQERRLEFEIVVMMRDLGWSLGGGAAASSPGAYAMRRLPVRVVREQPGETVSHRLETIRFVLTGFEVPGCSKMRPVRERFVERDNQGGIWIYSMVFALTTAAVEPSRVDTFPLFVLGVAQERGGVTTITLAPAPYVFSSNGRIHLPHGNVLAIRVSDPGTGAQFVAGVDYQLDRARGIVTRTAAGAIMNNATVDVAFGYAEVVTAFKSNGCPSAPAGASDSLIR
jgi:hypothetical protein